MITIIPHTTSVWGTRFEADLAVPFLQSGVFDAQNPTSTPPAKLIKKLGVLTADELAEVEDAVRFWLGL